MLEAVAVDADVGVAEAAGTSVGVGIDVDVDVVAVGRAVLAAVGEGTAVAATLPVTTFTVKGQGIHLDNGSNRLLQTVQVLNTGTQPATGPIALVLEGLSLSTTLLNATDSTDNTVPAGSPYIIVTSAGLSPGKSVTVTLEFSIPTPDVRNVEGGYNLNVTYTPRVLSGVTVP